MAHIIIVGCGRVGSQLATLLSQSEDNVMVIDKNASSFANLGRNFNGNTVTGVGFDEDVLTQAGVQEADVVCAVTQNDNANLMVAEVCRRIFRVPRVVARVYNPARERSYMQLGIDYVCGTSLVAERVYGKVLSGHEGHIDTFGEYEVLRFSIDLSGTLKGQIKVSQLEQKHGIRIVCFERRDGYSSSIPTKGSVLYHGDIVLACVHKDLIGQFSKYMQH